MVHLHKVLDKLFVSKVRIKCLQYFYTHQDVPVHLRALSRILKEEINAVRREVMRMNEIKLLRADVRGNKKYFHLNTKFPFHDELSSIILKSTGLGEIIIKEQNKLGEIFFASLTAHYSNLEVHGTKIDLAIIGEVNLDKLGKLISDFEEQAGKQINYTVLSLSDFNLRKKRRDPFVLNLLLDTKVLLVGNREEYVDYS